MMMMTTTTKRANPRRARTSVFRLALLLAPFLVVFLGGRLIATAYGDAVAGLMASVASWIDAFKVLSQTPQTLPMSVEESALEPEADPTTERTADFDKDGARPAPHRATGSLRSPDTLLVPARRLLRITARQLAGIDAVPAVDARSRTEGLSLSGVQRLGLGLLEGDVVTSINGLPTATKDAAIAAAMAAWKSGKRWTHAVLLRQGSPIAVSVEVPEGR